MDSQVTHNIEENLLPSSFLDDAQNSEDENDSNSSINFNENHSFFNDNKSDNSLPEVIHFYINI
jgi:hypothetical protein